MLPQNASLDISSWVQWRAHTQIDPLVPNGPIRGAVTLRSQSRYVKSVDWSKIDQSACSADFSSLRRRDAARLWVGVWAHTQTNSQPGCGCVCVCVQAGFGLCLAVSQTATGLTGRGGGRSSNKPFRTESEYTYYTEMLYEKPMWVWNIAQYTFILVDLNNGIMISRNGHDMGPLSNVKLIYKNITDSKWFKQIIDLITHLICKYMWCQICVCNRHLIQIMLAIFVNC